MSHSVPGGRPAPDTGRAIDDLLEVMRRLRDPDGGCDWDRQQDFASIAPYTVEEAYEVADAVDRADLDDLCDELGDLLLQVVFHAQMASEIGAFDFEQVAQSIVDKMVRRHPHVFGDTRFESVDEMKAHWESLKADERASRQPTAVSALDGIAGTLPALVRAGKLQSRAARVGFDWPDVGPVYGKLDEEILEVREAADSEDAAAVMDEVGDLLFTVVNLSRHHRVDPESALRSANRKFETRFRHVERVVAERTLDMQNLDLEALDQLWEDAKRSL